MFQTTNHHWKGDHKTKRWLIRTIPHNYEWETKNYHVVGKFLVAPWLPPHHLYVLSICIIYMYYLYVLSICTIYMYYIYIYKCIIYMYYLYVLSICIIYMYYLHVLSICIIYMYYLYVLSICIIYMYYLYVLSICIIYMYLRRGDTKGSCVTGDAGDHSVRKPTCDRALFCWDQALGLSIWTSCASKSPLGQNEGKISVQLKHGEAPTFLCFTRLLAKVKVTWVLSRAKNGLEPRAAFQPEDWNCCCQHWIRKEGTPRLPWLIIT